MHEMGIKPRTLAEAQRMIASVDVDRSGTLDFGEFLMLSEAGI